MQSTRAGTRPSAVTSLALLVALDGDGGMREWRRRARAPLGGGGGSAGTVCRGQEESGRGVARAHPSWPSRSRRSTLSRPSCSSRRRPSVRSWISSRRRSGRSRRRCASCASRSRTNRAQGVPPPPAAAAKPGPAGRARGIAREAVRDRRWRASASEEHGQAVLEFSELMDRFPQHPLASNSQYWIGEAYYRQRDFRQALAEFQKLADVYPQSAQVPEALLKLGMCSPRAQERPPRARAWEQRGEGLSADRGRDPGAHAAVPARRARARRALRCRGPARF